MTDTTTKLAQEYPIVNHVSIVYLDKEAQACNLIETEWKHNGYLVETSVILLN